MMLRLYFAGVLLAMSLLGADISGIWTCQAPGRDGAMQDLSFQFVQNGDTLTGKMYGDNASTPITDAKISGNQITFSIRSQLNGQVNRLIYTGTIEGAEIRMKREREGGRNGQPPPAAANPARGANQNQVLVLKRLA
jgi:hypothetical protein